MTTLAVSADDLLAKRCRADFWTFVRVFWHTVPGAAKLIPNWHMEVICKELQELALRVHAGLPKEYDVVLNQAPGTSKSTLTTILFHPWLWTFFPRARILCASHTTELVLDLATKSRAVITSDLYRRLFPDIELSEDTDTKGLYRNNHGGDRLSCTVAGKTPMGQHAHIHICDDILDPKKARSELERLAAKSFLTEILPSRKVDKAVTPLILVMQRLCVGDPTDVVLEQAKKEHGTPVRHICMPDELSDLVSPPELAKYYEKNGGLFDPVRLSRTVMDRERASMGDYAYCNPYQSPVLMSDLSLKMIGEVRVGDEVVGFTTDNTPAEGKKFRRRTLVRSLVTKVIVSRREVVKVTLDSGKVIYCTPDHMWYTGRPENGRHHTYAPVSLTRDLQRVCDDEMPVLSAEDMRDAGWLGGFFDAEGSAVITGCSSKNSVSDSCLISFSQGNNRNAPLCRKLERTLDKFGFDYGMQERTIMSKVDKAKVSHTVRWYYLKGKRMPMIQRFLHIANPTKWRDRITNGAYTTRLIIGQERPVKIEPDGVWVVYGLTTTTGNYVVWGFASKNCTQYKQLAHIPGGGMFRVEWFSRRCRAAPYKAKRIRYWDRASTLDGCATAGVLMAKDADGSYYVEDMVVGQWEPDERNKVMRATALKDRARYGPQNEPRIYVEAEGGSSGRDAWLGVVRSLEGFPVYEDRVTGAKDVRAEPWATQLAAGNVWLVDNDEHKGEGRRADWDIDAFVQEHLRFKPDVTVKRLGGSKDRIDSCSGAFNLLSGINVNSVPLRVIDLGRRNTGRARVLFCSEAELPSILIDRPTVLVHIGDPSPAPERQPDTPVHGLSRLMGRVWVRFADVDPAEVQDRWNEVISHIGLRPEECILTRETARKVWGFLLRKTDPPYEAVVFCSETADRRARTLAYAFADSLGYRRNEVILSHDGMYSNYDGPPPNNHIYAMFKAGRAGMMG